MWRALWLPKIDAVNWTERQRYGHISLTGPHWGPFYSSMGINAPQCWNPTLEIIKNKNRKISTYDRMDGQTDILYWHLGDLNPWSSAACATRNYGPCKWSPKIDVDNRTERWRDGHIISTGPHWYPLYPIVGINVLQVWTTTLEINTN